MSSNTLQEKLYATNLSLLYTFSIQLTAKKSQVTDQVLLSMLWRGGGAEAAEDVSYRAWKQLTRISLKQHCAMLGK
jgi:hypothetical protein